MKLALIRRHFSRVGGAELYVQRLLAALAEAGHELHLFAEHWESSGFPVSFHPILKAPNRGTRPTHFARAVDEAISRHTSTFDCIFSFDRTIRQDVYRAGDGVHREWLMRRRQFAPWWKKPFIGWSRFHRSMLQSEAHTLNPKNTGHVIVNSLMVGGEIQRHFKFPTSRIHLIRNGIHVDRFQSGNRDATRKRLGFAPSDCVVLFVGSGWERKGLKYLVRALDRIDLEVREQEWHEGSGDQSQKVNTRLKLLVVGKGKAPLFPSRDLIIAGAMPDIENAYAAADIFVLPAIYEPSANVVFEALAAGLPVITSRQNGASEVIQEGTNGTVLEDPSCISELARAIQFWIAQRFIARPMDPTPLQLEQNVKSTLRVVEEAAAEKKRSNNLLS